MKKIAHKKAMIVLTIAIVISTSFIPMMGASEEIRSSNLQVDIQNIDQNRISIDVRVPEFAISTEYIHESSFTLLKLDSEGFMFTEGQAKLPMIRRMIEIPQGSIPTIQIISERWESTSLTELNLPERILPVQPSALKQDSKNESIVLDEDYYKTDECFPYETIRILEINEIRGRRFVIIELAPLRYNPIEGKIDMMISFECIIELSEDIDMIKTIENIQRYSSSSFEEMYEQLFANYGYYDQLATSAGEAEGYLIIVYDDFYDEISPLADWKTTIGYETTVTLTSEIPGGVTADNIKAYIQDAYDNWVIPPTYLLLVGDTPQIPTFTGSASGWDTDTYYGTMDDDIFSDIYIGRFPASTSAHVVAMVDKTLYYEAGNFDSNDWIKNATFIAGVHNNHISEGTHNYCIDTHLLPNNYSIDKLYEVTYGATTQDVTDSINAGASLVVFSGHGSTTSWYDGPPFTQDNVQALTNEHMYPFVCSHSCQTGRFSVSECFGETWLRVPNKGALAFWGSSANTYWTEDDTIQKKVFDAWWDDGMTRIGQMTDKGLYDAYVYHGGGNMPKFVESYNVLGDASLIIWTEDPFTPEHDIAVSNLDIPSVIAHNKTHQVSALVKNVGNNTETSIVVDFKVNDSVLDTTTISSLEPLQSTMVSFDWDPDVGVYLVAIESHPIPDEYDLANNQVNKTVMVIYAPRIQVSPGSLSFMMPTNAIDSESILIENLVSAEAVLEYSISFAGDLGGGWLSSYPESGSVDVGSGVLVNITVDTTGLSEGEYSGEVIISSNDLNHPEIVVPVDLIVVYGNDMRVVSINSPVGTIAYGEYVVNATVQNLGFYSQDDVLVNLSIFEGFLDYFEDFEDDDGGYDVTGGVWQYGSPSSGPSTAFSGDFCWGTNLEGNYPNNANARLDSPEIVIPQGVTASFSFYHWYDIEDGWYTHWDGGNVKISVDNGVSWELLGSYLDPYPGDAASSSNAGIPGEPCFTGNSNGWELVSFDVTDYAGETVRFRWHFGSDGSVTYPGWYIDDVRVVSEYGFREDNKLVFSSEELVSLAAYESVDVLFSPLWEATSGNYTIQVTTMLEGDENPGNDVLFEVVFVEGPSLAFDPAFFDFGLMMVNTTSSTSFSIWNDNVGTLSYVLSETCDWVSLSSDGGSVDEGEVDTIMVYVNTTGLEASMVHTCDISISSDGGDNVFSVSVFVVDDTTEFLDVEQDLSDRGFRLMPGWDAAQEFVPSYPVLSRVELYMTTWNDPVHPIPVEIRKDDPIGDVLFEDLIYPADVTTSFPDWGWVSVDTSVAVDVGETYVIVLRDSADDDFNHLMWGVYTSFGIPGPYPDGNMLFRKLGFPTWMPIWDFDSAFKTYGYE